MNESGERGAVLGDRADQPSRGSRGIDRQVLAILLCERGACCKPKRLSLFRGQWHGGMQTMKHIEAYRETLQFLGPGRHELMRARIFDYGRAAGILPRAASANRVCTARKPKSSAYWCPGVSKATVARILGVSGPTLGRFIVSRGL